MRELNELMSGVLMCAPEALPADSTPLRDVEGWDSLRHVLLIVTIENKVNSKLTAEQIRGIVTIGDVGQILKENGIDG
jgi:acyl carrier protein